MIWLAVIILQSSNNTTNVHSNSYNTRVSYAQLWRSTLWRTEPRTETRASPARVLLRRRPPRRPSLLRTRPEELGEKREREGFQSLPHREKERARFRLQPCMIPVTYQEDECFAPFEHDTVSESTGDHTETPRRNTQRKLYSSMVSSVANIISCGRENGWVWRVITGKRLQNLRGGRDGMWWVFFFFFFFSISLDPQQVN